jgi:hypothetical protein
VGDPWIIGVEDNSDDDEEGVVLFSVGPFARYDDAERHPTKVGPNQKRWMMCLRSPDDPTYRTDTMEDTIEERTP